MRAWLDDRESGVIFWIVGAPGAGKSTIATTIANELRRHGHPCAKFFAKRDIPGLRDPRRIFTSIAYSLAERHDGLKAALMLALGEKTNVDIQDDDVFDQFQKLIKGPLLRDLEETGSLSQTRSRAYPVVVIDALDEFNEVKCQLSLLESLANWPNELKLVITSRYDDALSKKIGGVCRCIDLAVGNDASLESKNDIGIFFAAKFDQMRKRNDFEHFILPPGWPGMETIQEMTDFAAGLFIWADMAISYVGAMKRNAGYDPVERLGYILSDIRNEGRLGIRGVNAVDSLYARIIVDAFPDSQDGERDKLRAKQILAAILLAKEPLRKEDLVELASADGSDSHNAVTSTLLSLKSIIPASDGLLRTCHKSISDFALSIERSSIALSRFVTNDSECRSYLIDTEEESKRLALACLHWMHRKLFTSDSDKTAELLAPGNPSLSHSDGFSYALQHWFDHLEDAGDIYHPLLPNLKSLGGAIEVAYGRLERFSEELELLSSETDALVRSICCAIDLAMRCIQVHTSGQGNNF